MHEHLKHSIMAIDRSLTEISSLIRCGTLQLTEDELTDLFIIEEVQSVSLSQLMNIARRSIGGDDFLSEIESERENWAMDPYPGEDDEEEDSSDSPNVMQEPIDMIM